MPTLNWANPELKTYEQQMQNPLFLRTPPELGLTDDIHFKYANEAGNIPYNGKKISAVLHEIRQDTVYQRLFKQAYPGKRDAFRVENLYAAIAAFEQSLVSFGSGYDRFVKGESQALSENALKGKALFSSGQLNCQRCHSEPHFSNGEMYRVDWKANDAKDKGLYDRSGKEADLYRFRVPSLRNIAITAPYFHDGSLANLTELFNHFSENGHSDRKDDPPVKLNAQERQYLIAFFESLTDPGIALNPWFQSPWPNN